MNYTWMKKGLVVSVIFLFLGVALTPCIQSTDATSTHKALVEINIDAVGIPGLKSQTLKLAEEQLRTLESIISHVDQKLNNASTTEEAAQIIEDAVEQLHLPLACLVR
jgi:predicted transglutaminase-like cysteine proteinase